MGDLAYAQSEKLNKMSHLKIFCFAVDPHADQFGVQPKYIMRLLQSEQASQVSTPHRLIFLEFWCFVSDDTTIEAEMELNAKMCVRCTV